MTNEEIKTVTEHLAAMLDLIRKTEGESQLSFAERLHLTVESSVRSLLSQAYEEAARAVCTCYHGEVAGEHLESCPAFKLIPLKHNLAAFQPTS